MKMSEEEINARRSSLPRRTWRFECFLKLSGPSPEGHFQREVAFLQLDGTIFGT